MKIKFNENGNIGISPESNIEMYAINCFIEKFDKGKSKIEIYKDTLMSSKIEINNIPNKYKDIKK